MLIRNESRDNTRFGGVRMVNHLSLLEGSTKAGECKARNQGGRRMKWIISMDRSLHPKSNAAAGLELGADLRVVELAELAIHSDFLQSPQAGRVTAAIMVALLRPNGASRSNKNTVMGHPPAQRAQNCGEASMHIVSDRWKSLLSS